MVGSGMLAAINGINLAYSDQGQGLPVVFVHAFPLSREMWTPQAEALAGRFRIITVDLRGHGESDAPLWRYTLEQFSDDLRGLLDHLAVRQAVFVGLSMGGYTLFAFYRRYADRVKALVLADTRAQADTEEGRAKRVAMAQTAYRNGPAAVAREMLPILFSPAALAGRPDLIQLAERIIGGNQVSGILGDLMAMADRPDSRPMLRGIACPTLVLVGEWDQGTPPADARVMAEGIPGAKLEIIPQAGHLSNLEQPEAFNRALVAFLETLRA
jgi:3-oxoadipate enol-lactonase